MSSLCLTTDFGWESPFLQAAIASLELKFKKLSIQHISHNVEGGDLNEAVYLIQMMEQTTPEHCIHIIAVDFEERKDHDEILYLELNNRHYISYNSGLLSLLGQGEPKLIKRYTGSHWTFLQDNTSNILNSLSQSSFLLESFEYVRRLPLQPAVNADSISGTVVHVDAFGNVFTNITRTLFESMFKGKAYRINLSRHEKVQKTVAHEGMVRSGDPACFFDAADRLVVAFRRGNAQKLLGLNKGSSLLIEGI